MIKILSLYDNTFLTLFKLLFTKQKQNQLGQK